MIEKEQSKRVFEDFSVTKTNQNLTWCAYVCVLCKIITCTVRSKKNVKRDIQIAVQYRKIDYL